MSTFEVKVRKIEIFPHDNADLLEIGKVDDYNVVVGKGLYKTGDLVAYIPISSILPDTLIEEMNLVGKLAGSAKNRVKEIRLRKVLSQGLCLRAREGWMEGDDVAEQLGITKYIPSVPAHMAGEWQRVIIHSQDKVESAIDFKFDIENIKKFPYIFQDGEDVTITEKIHGTFMCVGLMPNDAHHPDMVDGQYFVSSKGLASRGIFLKDSEKNAGNVYIKTVKSEGFLDKVMKIALHCFVGDCYMTQPVWLVGEVFGAGVQDLRYGQEATSFRAFGIKAGNKWLDYDVFLKLCSEVGIETVPVVYRGPFSKDVVAALTNGATIVGNGCHLREGVVVCATKSEWNGGRKILKSVSEAYLFRKGEQTEYE